MKNILMTTTILLLGLCSFSQNNTYSDSFYDMYDYYGTEKMESWEKNQTHVFMIAGETNNRDYVFITSTFYNVVLYITSEELESIDVYGLNCLYFEAIVVYAVGGIPYEFLNKKEKVEVVISKEMGFRIFLRDSDEYLILFTENTMENWIKNGKLDRLAKEYGD